MFGLVLAVIVLIVVVATVALATLSARSRGFQRIARCNAGHYFTSTVVPGASLKAIRLGWVRFQKCPVGNHWAIVSWVDPASLTDEQRVQAQAYHDTPIP
jgi:hypothetical protein